MDEKLLTEMSATEFEALLDGYIDRSSEQSAEVPAGAFFELLFAHAAQRATKTVEVEGRVVNGRLVLAAPGAAAPHVYIRENQIVIGDQRVVVKLME